MKRWIPTIGLQLTLLLATCPAQQKRLEQDPHRNNLRHPDGYKTCAAGTLGAVTQQGRGPVDMILIAGAGFGGNVYADFMRRFRDDYTLYAVTLAGFDGTAAPPMPPVGTSYGKQTWTRGAVRGIEALVAEHQLHRPVLVAHWLTAPRVALQYALESPEKVRAVVIISGQGRGSPDELGDAAERAQWVDTVMAPLWFKTVTRETWDDNNFYPHDYARHPVRALQLWRTAQQPPLPVWVRYLCESLTDDLQDGLEQLAVPVLIIKPGFDPGLFVEPGNDYMHRFCHASWEGVEAASDRITVTTIPETRAFIMDDRPVRLHEVVSEFLTQHP